MQKMPVNDPPYVDRPYAESRSARWYAIYTRSRHEKTVHKLLFEKGFDVFLPLNTVKRHLSPWRCHKIELPLFPGYLFSKFIFSAQNAYQINSTFGVVGIISVAGEPSPIPEEQVETIRKVLTTELRCQGIQYLKRGQKVLIKNGPLAGLSGKVISQKNKKLFILSIDLLSRAVAVELCGYELEHTA